MFWEGVAVERSLRNKGTQREMRQGLTSKCTQSSASDMVQSIVRLGAQVLSDGAAVSECAEAVGKTLLVDE